MYMLKNTTSFNFNDTVDKIVLRNSLLRLIFDSLDCEYVNLLSTKKL